MKANVIWTSIFAALLALSMVCCDASSPVMQDSGTTVPDQYPVDAQSVVTGGNGDSVTTGGITTTGGSEGNSGQGGSGGGAGSDVTPPNAGTGTPGSGGSGGVEIMDSGTNDGSDIQQTGGTQDTPTGGTGGGNVVTSRDPVIPPIAGECPAFQTGQFNYMGVSGEMEVGPKMNGTGAILFYWHGTGSRSSEFRGRFAANIPKITGDGGIIVSFQTSSGTGGDCSGTATFSMDDFDIVDQMVACAIRDHNIDPHRIYTTGCSAGGLQAGCMAAQRSSYVAAAAPNSGGMVFPQPIEDPTHVPALMTMHGGPGDQVIVSFTTTSATNDSHFKNAGGFVVNCNHGGSHCGVPGEMYEAAWQFMMDHPFGVDPEPYANGLPASFPDACEIF